MPRARPCTALALALVTATGLPAIAEGDAALTMAGVTYSAEDVAAGERTFERKCFKCHGIDGENYQGPHLDGVLGRRIASVPGFSYSEAMQSVEGRWTPERLQAYLTDPRDDIEGVAMSFGGFGDDTAERDRLIAFLASVSR